MVLLRRRVAQFMGIVSMVDNILIKQGIVFGLE